MSACGTYAGYQAHVRHRQQPCQPCRDANADYTRQHRARNEETRRAGNARQRAYSRALSRLAAEHHARFLVLYAEELAR